MNTKKNNKVQTENVNMLNFNAIERATPHSPMKKFSEKLGNRKSQLQGIQAVDNSAGERHVKVDLTKYLRY